MDQITKLDNKSKKYDLIVNTATDLFMQYGVKRVTVEEICKTAKISKMTFYNYFKNKSHLAEYVIFSILDDAQLEADAIWKQLSTFEHKINQIIKLKMSYAKKFSKEFFVDFMDISPQITQRLHEYSHKNQITFVNMIEQAQKAGSIRSDISLKLITYMLSKAIDISEDENFMSMYDNSEDPTWELINFYFYGIMGKKK